MRQKYFVERFSEWFLFRDKAWANGQMEHPKKDANKKSSIAMHAQNVCLKDKEL
jgi:hypothetical protein